MEVVKDVKRTCPAIQASPDDEHLQPGEYVKATPGKARRYQEDMLMFCCPGCGITGGIHASNPRSADRPSWEIVAGTLDDVTSLTLHPSIECRGCCGWHGHLKAGVFKSC